jgi:glycosyltransferase involved in cell wall biosynthesis
LDQVLDRLCVGKYAGHYHHREAADLVRELIERGFVVDCIYDRAGYLIENPSEYDFILDEWDNMARWATQNPKARKLFHGTTCHWLYWNRAELQRLDWIFRRRGAALAPERQLPAMLGLADADLVTYYGSDAALQHYGPVRPKLRKVWVCPTAASPVFSTKDWSAAKRRFLWFGSSSWVHRGLDLVLEAFMQTPDLELFICGSDRRFLDVYGEDLKKLRNVHHIGFVTPDSAQFRELVSKTAAVVYASAAEGCSTSIVQCMRFGVIPIVTEATGLSVHDFWPALAGHTDLELISDIVKRCTALAEMPDRQVEALSRRFWEFADRHHSRPAFRTSLNTVLDELLR